MSPTDAAARKLVLSMEDVETIQRAVRSLDCGYHYCRYCDAGTSNGWKHSRYCAYVQSIQDVIEAKRILAGEPSAKGRRRCRLTPPPTGR